MDTKSISMGIKVFDKTKIYIACRANFLSGGSETLHQIAYYLRNNLKINALMYYYDFDNSDSSPVCPDYESYNIPYVLNIKNEEDTKDNILLVNESLHSLLLLRKYNNIRKGIIFLSVDNYYFEKLIKHDDIIFQKASNILSLKTDTLEFLVKKYNYKEDEFLRLAHFYILQCHRAMYWFKDLNPSFYLPKIINQRFLGIKVDISKKEDIVAYNPTKGVFFTERIVSFAKDIKFVPLINMDREKIVQILKVAKVYIDFGNHPGQERIPREAAMLGCCVITNKKGSAGYFEDLPIPDEYKFEDDEANIPNVVQKIRACLVNYQDKYKDFDYYRKIIKDSYKRFINNLQSIFVKD